MQQTVELVLTQPACSPVSNWTGELEKLAQESLENWAYEGKIASQLNRITFLIEPLEKVSCADMRPPTVFSSVLAIIPIKLPLTAGTP